MILLQLSCSVQKEWGHSARPPAPPFDVSPACTKSWLHAVYPTTTPQRRSYTISVQGGPDRIGLLDKPPASSAFLLLRASSRTHFPMLLVPPMRVWSNMSVVVQNLYCVRVTIMGILAVET